MNSKNTSFLEKCDLEKIGFASLGDNVLISRKASIYGAKDISIGSNVRIDDFCILSGKISISKYIHIASYTALYGGQAGIYIDDFANISSRICIYAISDDFSGKSMTNPMIPEKYKNIVNQSVYIGKHVVIGSNCTILPGVCINEGCAIGAMSLVKNNTDAWGIYAGIPAYRIKERSNELIRKCEQFLRDTKN